MTTHLVIPDAHDDPAVPKERFVWLSNLILDRKPDVIVCLGDFADMGSLSSYDKGKKEFEGRRYANDIASACVAITLLDSAVTRYNAVQASNRKRQYRPRKVMCLGNHEDRINRVVSLQPELDGTISVNDLPYRDAGWEVHSYRDVVAIDGISYCHSFPSGIMGTPISGATIGSALTQKLMCSATVGHSHLLDHHVRPSPDGRRIHGLSAGCYTDPRWDASYAKHTKYLWHSGVVLKHAVQNGEYDIETISYERIRNDYS